MSDQIPPPASDFIAQAAERIAYALESTGVRSDRDWSVPWGENDRGWEELLELADATGFRIDWLLIGEGPMKKDDFIDVSHLPPGARADMKRLAIIFLTRDLDPSLPPYTEEEIIRICNRMMGKHGMCITHEDLAACRRADGGCEPRGSWRTKETQS